MLRSLHQMILHNGANNGFAGSWADDEDLSQVLVLLHRPGFLLCLFIAGWALDVRVLAGCQVDYASAMGLSREESCQPQQLLVAASALSAAFVMAYVFVSEYAASLGASVLWAPVVVYVLAVAALCMPSPAAVDRRLGFRRPLRRALWRCFFPSIGRATPFLEVFVADGLTSTARCFFDLGVGFCALRRTLPGFNGIGFEFDDLLLPDQPILHGFEAAASLSNSTLLAANLSGKGTIGGSQSTLGRAVYGCSRLPLPFFLWALPTLIRAVQCTISARATADDWLRKMHYVNLAKYLSALPVILCAYGYLNSKSSPIESEAFEALWAWAALINAVFSCMWDLVMDWGLLQPPAWGSRGTKVSCSAMVLRPTLLLHSSPVMYHTVIATNMVGRTLWSLRWSTSCRALGAFTCPSVQQACEVVRRCIWNVLRIEWECIKKGIATKVEKKDSSCSCSEEMHFQLARATKSSTCLIRV